MEIACLELNASQGSKIEFKLVLACGSDRVVLHGTTARRHHVPALGHVYCRSKRVVDSASSVWPGAN